MPASANIDQIFSDALAQPEGKERARLLDEVCGSDVGVRERVERLLRAHANAESFLETPAAPSGPRCDIAPAQAGTRIGPYQLLEQIGEGGMGVVYVAEQLEPVKRQVALKIIKPGMDTRQVIARFEAERQALSLMDHPNIARVLDAGTIASDDRGTREASDSRGTRWDGDGRPYFVMELVRGTPITQYCDERCLSSRQRLELFVPICQAIQHAHQKGIIHRDLKPSNILVGECDGRPLPKVIDFGVAKAIGQSLMDRTTFTGVGQIVGTLEYMSPEQARLNQFDIDTRSDIYSLGVLLYELLTGTTPFDQTRLRTLAFDETLRLIREEEPEKPSKRLTRLRTTEQRAWSDSDTSRVAPTIPQHTLRGPRLRELDWIVMKCLEKDRNRRYETASGLARDVQRYLQNEPVVACPPSRWYRFRKLVRRNQTAFAAAAAALLVLVLGVATLATSNYLIRQEQARTRDEQHRTEVARRLAEQRAEEVREGLERLQAANALLDRGRWFAFESRWDDANAAFSRAIELHPQHVSVWIERGDLYTRLGLWDRAAADYAREMELREPNTTARLFEHALLRRAVGDEQGCRAIARAMRERFAGTVKNSFVEDIVRASVLAPSGAEDELPELISLAQATAPSRPGTVPFVLGTAFFRAGKDAEAIRQLEKALASESQMPIRWASYPVLAMAHHRLGHAAEARQALDEATRILDIWTQQRYAVRNGEWVTHQGADAYWPAPWWDYLECQLFYDEAKRLINGAPPSDDARLRVLRARALSGLKYLDQATVEYDAAVRLRDDDPLIRLEWRRHRGRYHVERREWREAAIEFAFAVELRPNDAYLWRYLAVAQFTAGDREAFRKTCRSMLEQFGHSEDSTAVGNVLLACTLDADSVSDMALLLPLAERAEPLWHWGNWARGAALYRAGRYEQSVQCFQTATKWCRPRAWDWCFLAMAHHRLGKHDEARQCLREAASWIDAANRRTEAETTDTQPAWGNWHETAVYPLLLREAEALLADDAATSSTAP